MELHHLRTFVTVAEEGNLTRAAERLCLSQPAVSAHIRALEEEWGMTLFRRTPKGMSLSGAGDSLLDRARTVLAGLAGLSAAAMSLAGSCKGSFALGINTDSNFLRVGELSVRMRREFPEIAMSLINGDSVDIIQDVRRGRLDGGFVYGSIPDGDLTVIRLASVALCVVGPSAWAERLRDADWTALADMPWIWVDNSCPFLDPLEKRFAACGCEPKKCVEADHEDILRALAVAGEGITLMREDEAMRSQESGELAVWPAERLDMPLSLVLLRSRQDEPVLRAVRDVILSQWSVPGEA